MIAGISEDYVRCSFAHSFFLGLAPDKKGVPMVGIGRNRVFFGYSHRF